MASYFYNYARTLLLNVQGQDPGCPGEELVPRRYVPVAVPDYVRMFRAVLFGVSPDRFMLNYRARQLLLLIHGTELQTYLDALDTRVTYDLSDNSLFDTSVYGPTVVRQATDDVDASISLLGSPTSPDLSGYCGYDFLVQNTGSEPEPVYQIAQLSAPAGSVSLIPEFENGLSSVMPLGDTGYKFQLTSMDPNVAWRISGFRRPSAVVDVHARIRSLRSSLFSQLFLPTDPAYLTFQACWEEHPDIAYQIGGLVAALIYRTHELHKSQTLLSV